MSLKPTKKNNIKSKYSEHYITYPEYITELICEKIAIRERKPLSIMFWQNTFWCPIYKRQLHLAKSLIKIYSPQAIINALKNPKSSNIVSLGMATQLDPIILEESKKIENLKQKETIEASTIIETPRIPTKNNKSLLGKLRNG